MKEHRVETKLGTKDLRKKKYLYKKEQRYLQNFKLSYRYKNDKKVKHQFNYAYKLFLQWAFCFPLEQSSGVNEQFFLGRVPPFVTHAHKSSVVYNDWKVPQIFSVSCS